MKPKPRFCRTKRKPYQKEGIRVIEEFNGRLLIADDMGLGKTFQSLYWALRNEEWTFPIIIVCPAHLKYNWERELWIHFRRRCEVLEGTRPPRRGKKRFFTPHQILIVNYDILPHWLDYLIDQDPQCVIIDECQYIKNPVTKRTQSVWKLCVGVPHLLPLSGTPLTNRPAELWPVLNLLWPKKFPAFRPFADRYCEPELRFGRWFFRGARNVPKLHRKLKKLGMLRRLKRDVMKDLPSKTRQIITVPIEDRKQYDQAESDFLTWVSENFSAIRADRAARAQRLVKIGYLKRLAAELKMKAIVRWIEDFRESSNDKLVVFGIHKNILGPLKEKYRKECVYIDGSVTKRKRQEMVERFQTDRRIPLFFGNASSAGTGTTLTAASNGLLIEFPWTPGEVMQLEDRLYRIGQKMPVLWTYLVAHDTIEEDLIGRLQDKQDVVMGILDGGEGERLPLMDQLVAAMRKRATRKKRKSK